jgi:hypothetical protein
MITVADMVQGGWDTLPGVAAWALVVAGLATVLFRSFPAMEISARLGAINSRRINKLRKADWELRHNTKVYPGVQSDDDLSSRPKLTDEERKEREKIVADATPTSMPMRMLTWGLSCGFCQSSWAALICFLFSSNSWSQLIPTCLAYAVFSDRVIFRVAMAGPAGAASQQQPQRSCGG